MQNNFTNISINSKQKRLRPNIILENVIYNAY